VGAPLTQETPDGVLAYGDVGFDSFQASDRCSHPFRIPVTQVPPPNQVDVASPVQPVDVKVRELIRELETDGWVQVRQVGSHRQFRHPTKPGTVTVPGNPGDDMAKGTVASVVRQAGLARRQR
jgi:predicted RNA binding protein YcfA (HicA-like mRNA interferase family)